jgi:hypothetical protein
MDESSIETLIGERARDENGRFKSVTPTEAAPEKSTEPEKTPEPVKEPEKTPEPVKAVEPVAVAPPVQPVESEKERAYKQAMREEREKRQRIEAELQALKQPKTPVDPWADLPGALSAQEKAFEERLFVERCNLTETIARQQHSDFEDVRQAFLDAAETNPQLWAGVRQAANPSEHVYREGLRIKELKDVNGDFSAYKTKLEKDIEARIRAEYEAKGKAPAVPASLNSDASPPIPAETYQGPKPLNQILRNSRS